jgi:hypothetical protein
MTRWHVLCRAGVCLALLVLATSGLGRPAFAAQDTVSYIGADDCKYCREWEAQYERHFKALCAARHVTFRAVQVATLRNIRDERYWPNDLKPVLSMFSSRSGSPHFLAISGSRVIVDTHGIVNWQKQILPLVE